MSGLEALKMIQESLQEEFDPLEEKNIKTEAEEDILNLKVENN
jgi:hypothetical protein